MPFLRWANVLPPTDRCIRLYDGKLPNEEQLSHQGQGVVMNTGIESFNAELSLKWMPMLYGCELYIDFNGRHLRIGYVEQEVGSWKWWCAPDEIGFAASPDAAQEEILSTLGISRSSKDE